METYSSRTQNQQEEEDGNIFRDSVEAPGQINLRDASGKGYENVVDGELNALLCQVLHLLRAGTKGSAR